MPKEVQGDLFEYIGPATSVGEVIVAEQGEDGGVWLDSSIPGVQHRWCSAM
jgi:hypothetical protein